MPPYREPSPEKGRPQSFRKLLMPGLGPHGQYNGVFETGWEDICRYPTQFDTSLEKLGRFENMYWTWHYFEMKKMYEALCEGSILGARWDLPDDPIQRKEMVDNLPLRAFLPTCFPFCDVPLKHVPRRERYAELGLMIASDAHDRAVAQLHTTSQRPANVDFSRAQQQFAFEARRFGTERRLTNEEATLMVAAAITAKPATYIDRQTVTRDVNFFSTIAGSEAGSLDHQVQLARMKKHGILKFHHSRMHTHSILLHFDSRAFEYYEVCANTDFAFKRCMISLDFMSPGAEMIWLKCPTSNDEVNKRPHVFSVRKLGVWLARKIEHGILHGIADACCPVCSSTIPACESDGNSFDLVEKSGGHGMDYKHAIMFDIENMHVKVDACDIFSDLAEPKLTPAQQRLLQASYFLP